MKKVEAQQKIAQFLMSMLEFPNISEDVENQKAKVCKEVRGLLMLLN